MPWTSKDSSDHTKKANTPNRKKQWREVANSVLANGGSESSAVIQANGVVKKNAMAAADKAMRRKRK